MAKVDVTVPVYNEEASLVDSIYKLHSFLSSSKFEHEWQIIIVDNASTDKTFQKAETLISELDHVQYLHLPDKGRGRALKLSWQQSSSEIVSYMDVDLSTDLDSFPKLIDAIAANGYDIAIGSRLIRGSIVVRSSLRGFLSRSYNLLLSQFLSVNFSDAQCGFKAFRASIAQKLIPQVYDDNWFFDTEILFLAENSGAKIKEIPIMWKEDKDSRVMLLGTIIEDIKGIFRLKMRS